MEVRNSISLKLFTLLIFSMELLAPVVLSGQESSVLESGQLRVAASHTAWGMCVSLLCEEAGIEDEREGKEQKVFQLLPDVMFGANVQGLVLQGNRLQPQPFIWKIHSATSRLSIINAYRI
jgi:hypothetical protein